MSKQSFENKIQTIFIEENLNHQQISRLCQFIDSNACSSLEFRRCAIADEGFYILMKSLAKHAKTIISLIFNIQMIDEQNRFKKFLQMLSNCSNLLQLQVHGNHINDDMFTQLYVILYEHCPQLNLLDIGDNKLTNKSIVHLCSLIIADEKRTGLEELIFSANQLITNAGWTELFFSISFNSRLRRLALDYNTMDDAIAAMLSMIIASSLTLTHLDLECCHLTEYAGQLILTLLAKYPVKLEEICLDKNPSILDSTRTLIYECLGLKSRRNSISIEQPLSFHLPLCEDTISTTSESIQPVKTVKKKNKTTTSNVNEFTPRIARDQPKSVTFNQSKKPEQSVEIRENKEEDEDIEELLPIDPQAHGIVRPQPYWNRI